ncbi:hypothetical protein [Streptomyces sp. NPDC059398]|uniref:hypothetical protein n=1 Tax=Streptomyces sp. NPDC059398 TaxID=3346820 RepID=UPI0036A5F5DE
MTVETDGDVAMLIVWDRGEAQLECGDWASSQIRQEHRDLRTPDQLLGAIGARLEWAHAKSGRRAPRNLFPLTGKAVREERPRDLRHKRVDMA